jgi:hypothetical protein
MKIGTRRERSMVWCGLLAFMVGGVFVGGGAYFHNAALMELGGAVMFAGLAMIGYIR